jgi:hypothetical protein
MITSRPTTDELTRGATLDLGYLIDSQALQLTGTLDLVSFSPYNQTMPLEEWNAFGSDFVSESTSKTVQAEKKRLRHEFIDSVNWVIGAPSGSPVMPFRLEVSPRIQFFVHITLENANGVLIPEYYSQAHTDRNPQPWNYYDSFDGEFQKWRGSSDWGFAWLDVGMVEGDYIQWDGTYFDVYHYGSLIYRSTSINSGNYIIPLGASNLEQTEAQAEEQGRLDDPLTPEDESIERPQDYNKKRIMEIRRALAYQNGNQAIGSLFLALLSYGALVIIRRGA